MKFCFQFLYRPWHTRFASRWFRQKEFIPQTVMPKVLQCDLESIKKLLATLEGDPASEATIESVQVRFENTWGPLLETYLMLCITVVDFLSSYPA